MAVTSLLKALAALTLVSSSIFPVAATSNSSSSICATSSKCIPFTIDVTWGPSDPSKGLSRNAILTNGSLPGPPLKMKVGDCVDFTVINNLPYNTGVHFHGIRQLGTPWADGVPGLSQYSITPGTSYMYQWTAEESGMYFYHAHYKGQMMDGLYGAIVIQPADNASTPFSQISSDETDVKQMTAAALDVEAVFASDWSQFTFQEFFEIEQTANIDDACTDSIILNGFGSVYCLSSTDLAANSAPQLPQILNGTSLTAKGCVPPSNPVIQGNFSRNLAALPSGAYDVCTPYTGSNYTYSVDPSNGWAAMSFISPAGFALFKVTIDSHKLYVYEINGNFIVPQTVDEFVVGPGDRVSFFVKLDQTPGDYQIRVANDGINQVISGFGVLSYKGGSGPAGVSVMNYGGQNTTAVVTFNPAAAAPFPPMQVAATADMTFVLDIMKSPAQPTLSWAWTLSGFESYNQTNDDTNPPLLFQNPANIPSSDLILETQYNKWVDLIIKVAGPVAEPHPIHKHANKFFAIGSGVGSFNFTSVAAAQAAGYPFNLENPPYVDGYTSTPAEGNSTWMVFRYQANTPGAWLLHCHVQTHLSGGMAVAILDAIDNFPQIPSDVGAVCPGSGSSGSTSYGSGGYGSQVSNDNSTSTGGATIATFTGAASSVVTPSFASVLFSLVAIAFAFYTL
ncbi:uncharacterized protein Z518_01967 [Rhinocladiella mackenziei CBS 650.93]|uniref:Laccase n=1 Tax=Rhinocladiella mackenziei CBS 650.93 TaxID=1442369 RepID=A0A0D2INB0_9EURO|nr:uncharacterized protein Z518_01967 [Rhinocladiella mackenziei CBS 650.93]KIX07314.1 hypothetical protein Z518_01967 [Rhinocladiella mackenziei CBS 650.93]